MLARKQSPVLQSKSTQQFPLFNAFKNALTTFGCNAAANTLTRNSLSNASASLRAFATRSRYHSTSCGARVSIGNPFGHGNGSV